MTKSSAEKKTYNEMITRIKEITETLRDPNGDIDQMIAMVNEAVDLIAECKSRLTAAGIQVKDALSKLEVDDDAEN